MARSYRMTGKAVRENRPELVIVISVQYLNKITSFKNNQLRTQGEEALCRQGFALVYRFL